MRRFLGMERRREHDQFERINHPERYQNNVAPNDIFTDEASSRGSRRRLHSLDLNVDRVRDHAQQQFIRTLESSNSELANQAQRRDREYEQIQERLLATERRNLELETQWQAQERQKIAAVRDTDRSRQEAQLLEDDRRECGEKKKRSRTGCRKE